MEIPARFQIEHWWHAIVLFGAVLAVASLIAPIEELFKWPIFMTGLGLFFLGVGEWINHPLHQALVAPHYTIPSGGVISAYPRRTTPIGLFFTFIGAVLLLIGICKIAWRA